VAHNINNTLTMFEPITFEIAIWELPFKEEIKLTTNSGAEVQKATIVNPITKLEIPNFFAILQAHSTNISAHLIKNINQIISKI